MPRGPITRARAKKFKEALLNLMKTNYLKDFEDDEMKEGTGYTTYACMTIDTVARLTDPLELPRGPITRARAKKFKEALLNLIKTNYLKDFEDYEMKEGTGHTTYTYMTIVVHED